MKRYFMMTYAPIVLVLCGCSFLAYGVAMDERGAGAIVSDKRITLTIQERFLQDDEVKLLDISTFCYNGQVYLVGEYGTAKERDKALEIAKGTPHVKSVTPYLLEKRQGETCSRTDNLKIATEIRTGLISDEEIRSTNIDEKVIHCHVVLLGIVGSKKEITKAIAHARSVTGVKSVTSYLEVAR